MAETKQIPEHTKAMVQWVKEHGVISGLPEEQKAALMKDTISRALNDERIADIAASYGLAKSTLNAALLRHSGDEWRDAQAARALTKLQEAQDGLDSATDVLSLARAREQIKSRQWELERLCRRLYGQDAPANTGSGISIIINTTHQPAVQQVAEIDNNTGNVT